MIKKPIKYLDKNLSLEEKKLDYKKNVEKMMNPFIDFNPDNFEPIDRDLSELSERKRIIPQKQLPLFGLKPKEIREGQMIGMYESKQDIYLIFAHRCNEMQNEIDFLKNEINLLKNNK